MKKSNVITEQQVEQIIQELVNEGFFDRLKATASGTFSGVKQGVKNFQSFMKGDPKGILPPKLMKNLGKLDSMLTTTTKTLTSASKDFNTIFPAGSEAELPKELGALISQYKTSLEQILNASVAVQDVVKNGIQNPQSLLKPKKSSTIKPGAKKPAPKKPGAKKPAPKKPAARP
jgi:hypothetical protein